MIDDYCDDCSEIVKTESYRIPIVALRMVRERTITLASPKCESAGDAIAIAHKLIGASPVEHVIAIMLNGANEVTGVATVGQGGMSTCPVSIPAVLRAVLTSHAAGFILAHNHPSGDPSASPEDVRVTAALAAAATIVGVPMLDHVIVTADVKIWGSVPS